MDELARYNRGRWDELARANVPYSRPWLDLTPQSARELVDPMGVMGPVEGQDVLCLASGGGQQSVAFALLGARVTVLDLSEAQLERDRQAAVHHGLSLQVLPGDMRDLSRFAPASFDLVWHAYSINFVPRAAPVIEQVARVLRPGGLYRLMWANPFVFDLDESEWNGRGYPITRPYLDGAEMDDPYWDVEDPDGVWRRVLGPREFRHTLSSVVNGLAQNGFVIRGLWEELASDPDAAPGTWEHFKRFAPPWLTVWAVHRPDVLK